MYICACSQWTGILPEQFFLLTINLLGQRYYPGLIPQPTLPTQAPTSLKKFLHQPTLHGWEAKATPSSRTPPGLQATHCFRPDQPSGQENERDVCFSSVLLHAPAAKATRLKQAIQSFSVHPQSLPSTTTTSNRRTFPSPQVETQPNHTCLQLLPTTPPPPAAPATRELSRDFLLNEADTIRPFVACWTTPPRCGIGQHFVPFRG